MVACRADAGRVRSTCKFGNIHPCPVIRSVGAKLAIQHPADISPTIVSQIHSILIHRLVNDRDLFLLDNTTSTLDPILRALIPNLTQGCCVVTGTAFDLR